MRDIDSIEAVNRAFYEAFASGNFAALEGLWSAIAEISVIHPGSGVLHGREAVMASWRQILASGGGRALQVDQVHIYQHGTTAYVTCHENFPEVCLVATNILVLEDDRWCLVHHQAAVDNRPAVSPQVDNLRLH